jgi:ubiquinone/menaquinone biosynthesis C-methylase UbiE
MALRYRRRQHELMDDDAVDPRQLAVALRFIRGINKYLGYTRATLGHLKRFSHSWRRQHTIRILDVATGSADIPRAILRWAERRGWDVRIIAIDRHTLTLKAAVTAAPPDARLGLVQADALRLPFADASFDYAITSMFLHHLDDDAAVAALAEMNRVARRGLIAADLLRSARAYSWITLFTLFTTRMIRHDAKVSVAQAFRKPEVLSLRDRAGIRFAQFHKHFGHRFVLAGEK